MQRIYGYMRRHHYFPDSRDDIVQKVFEIAWKRFDEYLARPQNDFWIFRIAENLAKYENRKVLRRQETLVADHAELERLVPCGESGLEQSLLREEMQATLYAFIRRLPHKQQAAILMRLNGLTYAEIGESLKISPEAARRRVGRAFKSGKDYFGYGRPKSSD